jgi:hypothetical protein
MKVSITFRPPLWQKFSAEDRPKVAGLIKQSAELLAAYKPKTSLRAVSFSVAADDPDCWSRMKDVGQLVRSSTLRIDVFYTSEPSTEEFEKARAIRIRVAGDGVDDDANSVSFNEFRILCPVCRSPDLQQIPTPYIVNRDPRRKTNQDLFGCDAGMIIVRQHIYEALRRSLADDVEWGPARCVDDRGSEEPLWFMRPRALMPHESRQQVMKRCRACKRPTEIRMDLSMNVEGNARFTVDAGLLTAYATESAHVYRAESFYGSRGDRDWERYFPIYISGPLWAALRDLKVNGIVSSEMCYTREYENPLLREAPALELDQCNRPVNKRLPKRSAKESDLIAKLPWDQGDGFIHFELRSGSLAMFDPMLGGEDGTYFDLPTGVYRMPVSAIRGTDGAGAHVDSGCLVFVDAAYVGAFVDAFDFDAYRPGKRGEKQLARVANDIGCRFAVCPALDEKLGCDFVGDGCYTLDMSQLKQIKD